MKLRILGDVPITSVHSMTLNTDSDCSMCEFSSAKMELACILQDGKKLKTLIIPAEYPAYVRRLISQYIHGKSWRIKKKKERALSKTLHGIRFLLTQTRQEA